MAENNHIRFYIATQSLKPNNQLHLIELNEESSNLNAKIFAHPFGEVWKLNSSPHDTRLLVSSYNTQKGSQVIMQSAILELPESMENLENKEYLSFKSSEVLGTEVSVTTITEHNQSTGNLFCFHLFSIVNIVAWQ